MLEVEKHLMRIRRWIQGVRRPFGITKSEILASADPAKRLHLEDLAGGIMEDMSVITNEIQQMLKIFAEMPKIPEIENPPPSEEA